MYRNEAPHIRLALPLLLLLLLLPEDEALHIAARAHATRRLLRHACCTMPAAPCLLHHADAPAAVGTILWWSCCLT